MLTAIETTTKIDSCRGVHTGTRLVSCFVTIFMFREYTSIPIDDTSEFPDLTLQDSHQDTIHPLSPGLCFVPFLFPLAHFIIPPFNVGLKDKFC